VDVDEAVIEKCILLERDEHPGESRMEMPVFPLIRSHRWMQERKLLWWSRVLKIWKNAFVVKVIY